MFWLELFTKQKLGLNDSMSFDDNKCNALLIQLSSEHKSFGKEGFHFVTDAKEQARGVCIFLNVAQNPVIICNLNKWHPYKHT